MNDLILKHFFLVNFIYTYKRVRPLTHSLTQYGPGDSMEDWVTNFGVQTGFKALTPLRRGFTKFCPLILRGVRRQKHVFEYNLAPNYLTMTKLHMG